jgi:hypothetical protein
MLEANILEDCLFELPPIDRLARWGFRHVDSPVRSVIAVASVLEGRGLMDGPVAGIYRAEFMDGVTREIIVEGNPLERDFDTVFFLKEGRKNTQLGHVMKFIIRDPEDQVSESLKDALRHYEAERDRAAAQLKCG